MNHLGDLVSHLVLNVSGLVDGETFRARRVDGEMDGHVDLVLLLRTMIRIYSEEIEEQAYLGGFLGSLLCVGVFLVLIFVQLSW